MQPSVPRSLLLTRTYPQTVDKTGITSGLWASLWTELAGLRGCGRRPALRQKVRRRCSAAAGVRISLHARPGRRRLRARARATEGADVGRVSGGSAVGRRAAIATTPSTCAMYERSVKDPDGFWARAWPSGSTGSRSRRGSRTPRSTGDVCDPLVRGRRAQRLLQLPRPAPRQARRPDRDHLGGRRPRRRPARSPTASCTRRSAGSPMC